MLRAFDYWCAMRFPCSRESVSPGTATQEAEILFLSSLEYSTMLLRRIETTRLCSDVVRVMSVQTRLHY
jgi:hypothetical protein